MDDKGDDVMLFVDDWLCMRHHCQLCGEAAAWMCVFCPASYCDQHANGRIKTYSFIVGDNYRVRHRVCTAHRNEMGKSRRRHSSKRKASTVPEDNSEAGQEIAAPSAIADSGNDVMENVGTCESLTEEPMSVQDTGSDGEVATVAVTQEPKQLNSKPTCTDIPSPDHEEQLHEKPSPDKKRKLIAAKLLKKNGIVANMVEAATLDGSESAAGWEFSQLSNGKPNHFEESPDLTTVVEKSADTGKRRWRAPVPNGYCSSVTTRRRSSLQETSQTPQNVSTANKLESPVKLGTMADTVTTLLEELSDVKDPELVNGTELVVDSN